MKKYILNLLLLVFLIGISSCIKEHPDSPPGNGTDPAGISANTTVNAVKALSAPNLNETVTITQDLVVSVVVVGDDQSGNYYKQLVVQDSTGGIMLMLDVSSLFSKYPIGRRLFIKLKGLVLVNNYGLYQIAGALDNTNTPMGIASSLIASYIFPGKWGITVVPKVVSISQLHDNTLQSELIELDNVQVKKGEITHPYYSSKTGAGIALESCSGSLADTAVIYTSKYANFANSIVLPGNGTVLAVYSGDKNNIPQLTLRDTSEVTLYGPRPCDN